MHKKILAGCLVAVCALTVWLARASTFSSVGSLVTVNNTTNNGAAYTVGSFSGGGLVSIQTAGLTATNAMYVNDQISMDGSNYFTVGIYYLNSTNAGTTNVYVTYSAPVYRRAQVVTTNSVQVGVNFQY